MVAAPTTSELVSGRRVSMVEIVVCEAAAMPQDWLL